jgi:hemerythrin-like domain-containing protein
MEAVHATQLLRNDHKVVRGLFRQAEASGARAQEMKGGVIGELLMMLEIHTRIEEEIFYPALRDQAETAILVENSFNDHREAKELIDRLRGQKPGDETYDNTLGELLASIELHVQTEESELFPLAERVLASQLEELGKKMHERKAELLELPEYSEFKPRIVQDPNGGEQMRKAG